MDYNFAEIEALKELVGVINTDIYLTSINSNLRKKRKNITMDQL